MQALIIRYWNNVLLGRQKKSNEHGFVDLKNKTVSYFASENGFIQEQQKIAIRDKQAKAKAIGSMF